eukprot:TRINITY_DN6599_c0_g1_i1.p1 TRINITY_DN6599_c0_g1~~TRINITY_DN6599_c0_g1_i1.p1  ORF type:complete len:896 (-),score=128.01 TRINITY_DN6599_c0_g1_i1:47-2734(-)
MGIPGFYRWMVERFPKAIVTAKTRTEDVIVESEEKTDCSLPNPNEIEFDYLYLDMNGIVHMCFNPKEIQSDDSASWNEYREVAKKSASDYVDRIFSIIRPRKLIFLALDGVAPRAKMNQQRARRFTSARQQRKEREKAEKGARTTREAFDGNQISPGTTFMSMICDWLHRYVAERIQTDRAWQQIDAIVSDSQVPGEGEHKIMDFIRWQRSQNGYDSNSKHAIYGADADLIMLGLSLHEPNLFVVREDPQFVVCHRCSNFGHTTSDCTATTVSSKDSGSDESRTVHVANLPPDINESILESLFTPCGVILDVRIVRDRETLQPKGFGFVEFKERDSAEKAYRQLHRKKLNGKKLIVSFAREQSGTNSRGVPSDEKLAEFQSISGLSMEESFQYLIESQWNVEVALSIFFDPTGDAQLQRDLLAIATLESNSDGTALNEENENEKTKKRKKPVKFSLVNLGVVRDYLRLLYLSKTNIPADMTNFSLEKWIDDFILVCTFGGNDFVPSLTCVDFFDAGVDVLVAIYKSCQPFPENKSLIEGGQICRKSLETFLRALGKVEEYLASKKVRKNALPGKKKRRSSRARPGDDAKGAATSQKESPNVADGKKEITIHNGKAEEPDVTAKLEYYRQKFGLESSNNNFVRRLCSDYLRTLIWVHKYYYLGCPSWEWFYPYHYPPLASDLAEFIADCSTNEGWTFGKLDSFELGSPFTPFEQLMAVLPVESALESGLPESLISLMTADTEFSQFYRSDFKIDHQGKRESQAVPLLAFVDQELLLKLVRPFEDEKLLTAEQIGRNTRRLPSLYANENKKIDSSLLRGYVELSLTSKSEVQALAPHLPGSEHFKLSGAALSLSEKDLEDMEKSRAGQLCTDRIKSLSCFTCQEFGHRSKDCHLSKD